MTHRLPFKISREDDIWMVRSPAVQGLLVTGDALEALLEELPAVVQALYEVCQEKG